MPMVQKTRGFWRRIKPAGPVTEPQAKLDAHTYCDTDLSDPAGGGGEEAGPTLCFAKTVVSISSRHPPPRLHIVAAHTFYQDLNADAAPIGIVITDTVR
ncbi:hypothetical protein K456DRAFT_48516 [Colletotrichum gloeosporioides 23]|nr:hypothetical protein K456DRAFT_48516 [Colletotrichum gloeosporioides 23]